MQRGASAADFKLEATHFSLNNSEEQRGGRVGIQLREYCVCACHLDTTFGFLRQCINYTRRKGYTAVMIERLRLAVVAIIRGNQ